MTTIRVDPDKLRDSAQTMTGWKEIADAMQAEAFRLCSSAPSYDGQFGPQVQAIGDEAAARLKTVAGMLEARRDFLMAKAQAFEAADLQVAEAIHIISERSSHLEGHQALGNEAPWVTSFIAHDALPAGLMPILGRLSAITDVNAWDDLLVETGLLGMLYASGELREASKEKRAAGSVLAGSVAVASRVSAATLRRDIVEWLQGLLRNINIREMFIAVLGNLLALVSVDGPTGPSASSPTNPTPTPPAGTPTPIPPAPTPTAGPDTPGPTAETTPASPTPSVTPSATPDPSLTPTPSHTPTPVPILPTNTPGPYGVDLDLKKGIEAVGRSVDTILEWHNLLPKEPNPLDVHGIDLVDAIEGIPGVPAETIRIALYAAGTLKGLVSELLERVAVCDPMYPLPEPVPPWPAPGP